MALTSVNYQNANTYGILCLKYSFLKPSTLIDTNDKHKIGCSLQLNLLQLKLGNISQEWTDAIEKQFVSQHTGTQTNLTACPSACPPSCLLALVAALNVSGMNDLTNQGNDKTKISNEVISCLHYIKWQCNMCLISLTTVDDELSGLPVNVILHPSSWLLGLGFLPSG